MTQVAGISSVRTLQGASGFPKEGAGGYPIDSVLLAVVYTGMIHVLATIQLQPGQRSAFLKEFHALIPLVHAEHGCIEYGSAVDCPTKISLQAPVEADTVVVIEKWVDEAALAAHLEAPHMGDYRKKVQGFVKSVTIRILQPSK